jgi:hypothetical protein
MTIKQIINQEFEKGINKASLLEALENHIDENYVKIHESAIHKKILNNFFNDVKYSGGYVKWKQKILNS